MSLRPPRVQTWTPSPRSIMSSSSEKTGWSCVLCVHRCLIISASVIAMPFRYGPVQSYAIERGERMREHVFEFPGLERLVYGKPAAAALAAEVTRIGAKRVFL